MEFNKEKYLKLRKSPRGIHSPLHELVDKMRKDFGETAVKGKGSFSYYLGMLKRVPVGNLYLWLAEIKDSLNLDTPFARRKIFWWKFAQWHKTKNARF